MTTSGKTLRQSKKSKKKRPSGLRMTIAWIFALMVCALCLGMIGYAGIVVNGQRILEQNLNKTFLSEASVLYDIHGEKVTSLYRIENRELVEYDEIPKKLLEAFIATEDKRYFEHTGIDLWAIGRALYKDIIHRDFVEGGSTITQQLAKNMFLSHEKTLFRKATEASIALALENRFSKDEILTMYLNSIYFGHGTYGVKTAAKKYFAVDNLHDLELWQIATLAGIPKSPNNYNPISNPERSMERRAVVLMLMQEQGYITEQQRKEARSVEYVPPPVVDQKKSFLAFIDYVLDEANEVTGLNEDQLLRGGYHIYTTMDSKAQRIMEEAFANDKLFQAMKDGQTQKMQGGMVILNHQDGSIVAMSGGRDYVAKGLNRALVKRQPGSAFKPIAVYAPALESGQWHPYSALKDELIDYNGYKPRNYDHKYLGTTTMTYAVQRSINAPAVWLLNQIHIKTSLDFIQKLEIPLEPEDRNLAIALGGLTRGVSPMDMAKAYSAFANGGLLYQPYSIVKIEDSDGREIYAAPQQKAKRVMKETTAYYMTEMLQTVVTSGTGTRARMDRPVAGKTGSTQMTIKGLEKYDSNVWFVGYTPEWTAAVWMGYDKTDANHYVTVGSGAAAALFKEVMSKSLSGRKVISFSKPKGLQLSKPPAGIQDLHAEYSQEERGVILNWSAPEGQSAFSIYRKSGQEEQFTLILKTPVTHVRDITVSAGESYQYYVVPYEEQTGQEGARSNVVEVVVPDQERPFPDENEDEQPDENRDENEDEANRQEDRRDPRFEEHEEDNDEASEQDRRKRRDRRSETGPRSDGDRHEQEPGIDLEGDSERSFVPEEDSAPLPNVPLPLDPFNEIIGTSP